MSDTRSADQGNVLKGNWDNSVDITAMSKRTQQPTIEAVADQNPYNHPGRVDPLKPDAVPKIGVRALISKIGIKLAPSSKEMALRKRAWQVNRQEAYNWEQINRPITRNQGKCCFITVGSEKGGVGKTTVTAVLSYTFARERQDRIVVADANPDKGSLPARLGVVCERTIKDLVRGVNSRNPDSSQGHGISKYLAKVPGVNISVLGGDTDPRRRNATTSAEISTVASSVEQFFSIGILDNGTGISHSAMHGSLEVSHSMALVIDNTHDAYEFVKSTLIYLEENGYDDIRDRMVLVICNKILDANVEQNKKSFGKKNSVDPEEVNGPKSKTWTQYDDVTADTIEDYFAEMFSDIVVIPYDPALAKSGPINYDDLSVGTQRSFQTLAAILSNDFAE